jgi:hypothetical protein
VVIRRSIRRTPGLLVSGVLLLLFLGLPGHAPAQPTRAVEIQGEPCEFQIKLNVTYSCQLEFSVRSSAGYLLTVSGSPGHSGVEVIAHGPHGEAQYTAAGGKVTANSISASLGRLGKVSMRFRPTGAKRQRPIPSRCEKGRPPSVSSQPGAFIGMFAFHGEHGYTDVVVHHARGGLGDPLTNIAGKALSCSFQETTAEQWLEGESVELTVSRSRAHPGFTVFEPFGNVRKALTARGMGPFLFLVLDFEKAAGMSILRTAAAAGGVSGFTYDSSLSTATVTPPAPFSGAGVFRRNADGSSNWSGDLAVALPGLGRVALTPGTADLATVAEHLKGLGEELKASR